MCVECNYFNYLYFIEFKNSCYVFCSLKNIPKLHIQCNMYINTIKPKLRCHLWDKEKVVFSERWPLKRGSIHMKFLWQDRTRKRWPFNAGGCLIEVTPWGDLSVLDSLCLNFFHLLARKPNLDKFSIYSNKFFHNFHHDVQIQF